LAVQVWRLNVWSCTPPFSVSPLKAASHYLVEGWVAICLSRDLDCEFKEAVMAAAWWWLSFSMFKENFFWKAFFFR
jgi:hypothetical protein